MTWSISASGAKDEIKTKIAEAHEPSDPKETPAFEAAKKLCIAQIDLSSKSSFSVSCSGSADYCSVSVSGS